MSNLASGSLDFREIDCALADLSIRIKTKRDDVYLGRLAIREGAAQIRRKDKKPIRGKIVLR